MEGHVKPTGAEGTGGPGGAGRLGVSRRPGTETRSSWPALPSGIGLWESYPRTLLEASGLAVGLPEGQMGNSEVGHLNLGRRPGRAAGPGPNLSEHPARASSFRCRLWSSSALRCARAAGTLHLMGLLGPGGVHAIDQHLLACVELGVRHRVPRIAIHGFLDGRDTLPTIGEQVVAKLQDDLKRIAPGQAAIATLIGRYYAMDRDRRWERTRLAYDAMVRGIGVRAPDPVAAVKAALARGETDEFVKPIVLEKDGAPVATMKDGDGVLCFNYRSDRMRQIVRALMHRRVRRLRCPRPAPALDGHHDAVRSHLPGSPGLSALHHGEDRRRGPGRSRPHPAAYRGDREVPARHLFLQRRDTSRRTGARSAPWCRPRRWRPTICARR